MKHVIGILVIAALGTGGYFAWVQWQRHDAGDVDRQAINTTQVERRSIRFAVNAAGEISPAEQVSVRPEINGKVAALPVDIGDRVKKGDVLFTLDDQELRNQRDATQTEVSRARLQLEQAQRNYERSQRLFEATLISVEEMENFKTQFDLGKNALDRANKDLAVVEERLTKTQIIAPFDCTILARPVSVGQAVSGSGGVSGGTEVLAIADLNRMIIQAHINQADVTRLKVNLEVEIQVEAVPGLAVVGTVERIAPQATIKNSIKGFLTRILLENVDPRVRPGMTANIKIPIATAENVLAVPLPAVFTEFNQEIGKMERFVYTLEEEGFERRLVQVGLSDFFNAEVQSGLEEGDVVCLEQPPRDKILPTEATTGLGKVSPSLNPGTSPPRPTPSSSTQLSIPVAKPAHHTNTSS